MARRRRPAALHRLRARPRARPSGERRTPPARAFFGAALAAMAHALDGRLWATLLAAVVFAAAILLREVLRDLRQPKLRYAGARPLVDQCSREMNFPAPSVSFVKTSCDKASQWAGDSIPYYCLALSIILIVLSLLLVKVW